MKRLLLMATFLLFGASALALTPAEKKRIKAEVWPIIELDGGEAILSPELTGYKIEAQVGSEVWVEFTWIEAFGTERLCYYAYHLGRQAVVPDTIFCSNLAGE